MRVPVVTTILLWAMAPGLLWLSAWRPHDESARRAERLPLEAGRFVCRKEYEITESTRALLGTEDAVWRRYEAADSPPVLVIGVFHSSNWKALHPPHTCLLGSNMEIVTGDEIATLDSRGAAFEYGRLLMRSLDRGGAGYLSLFVYLAPPDLVTGHYASFVMHQAPRAILRQDVAGALLRVETWISGGDIAAAEARCREVLEVMMPAAAELLR